MWWLVNGNEVGRVGCVLLAVWRVGNGEGKEAEGGSNVLASI